MVTVLLVEVLLWPETDKWSTSLGEEIELIASQESSELEVEIQSNDVPDFSTR